MTSSISRLSIHGIHDLQDISIPFDNAISIFMGPNGVGKSTVLNILVYLLARQWQRLAKQSFISVSVEFISGSVVTVRRSDCVDFISAEIPARVQQMANILADADMLDYVVRDELPDAIEGTDLELTTGLSVRDLRTVRSYMSQYSGSVRSVSVLAEATKVINEHFKQKILYLPTYRRIEQEIGDVLALAPSSMRRVQAEIAEFNSHSFTWGYTELVRFGMEDIKSLIDNATSEIKEYSRQQINSLSTRYLTAALRSRQSFERAFFDSLTDTRIREVLARVDDEELNAAQRRGITELLKSLRNRQGAGRLTRAQEHVASYFYMLAETHERISRREINLNALATVLNGYIGPNKKASYDSTRYEFLVKAGDVDIPLSGLSSGEKQLVSLFATLTLNSQEDFFVVIDEPELSLSVLWQERLISDIYSAASCLGVLAVTHSPFIYGENLSKNTRDLSDFIVLKNILV